jgi:AhpD family alkylhydroperoxidase
MAENGTLSNKEKAQVALGAAIGAGCRTCAEFLTPTLRSLGATDAELDQLVADALVVRDGATEVMRQKAGVLLDRLPATEPGLQPEPGTRIEELIRTGAAVAANCAPDALGHIERAKSAGATEAQIEVAIGVGRSVRSKAQSFSDEEIAKSSATRAPTEEAAACCGPMSGAGPSDSGACC